MTDVDPIHAPLPEGFHEIEGATVWADNVIWVINQLRDRTGGGDDNVTGAVEVITGAEPALPSGEEPIWEERNNWQFFATP